MSRYGIRSNQASYYGISLGTYVGPGDIATGAVAWFGLRAYNNATKGNNLIRLRRSIDNAEQDFASRSDGSLDVTAISLFIGSGTLSVVTWYDQGRGVTNLTQATAGSQPVFTLSGLGSLPILTFTKNTHYLETSSFTALSQPYTFGMFLNSGGRPSGGYNTALRSGTGSSHPGIFPDDGANNLLGIAQGTVPFQLDTAAADGTWWAFQGVFNGASSDANLNGVASVGSLGGDATNSTKLVLGTSADGFEGSVTECGVWPYGFSAATSSFMATNQQAYY